jgi:pimeloyl-ACP methyl ester carboxylesterase
MNKLQKEYMTKYKTVKINGLDIFYREAGPKNAPTILLLHGFPTSSHMFRNLIQTLSNEFHLVAPDYPGYGNSSMPLVDEFDYTFENMAKIIYKFVETIGLENYSLYLQDYVHQWDIDYFQCIQKKYGHLLYKMEMHMMKV